MENLDQIRKLIEKHGIPGHDAYDLPTSRKRFPDGAWYRMEISGVERPEVLEALLEESDKRRMPIHRLISTVMGATLLDDDELKRFAKLAAQARSEVIITPGPRASWDVGRQIATPEGVLSGLRHRGADQLAYYVADMMRCIEFGFRGFLVTDEGLMWLLNEMRAKGDIPKDVIFKISIFAGHANPAGGKVLQLLGANTFNPVGDLSLPALAAIRQAIDIPLDLHVYLSDSFGGFNRFYETPEMARLCAPCYYKIEPGTALAAGGGIYKPWTPTSAHAEMCREKVKYAQIMHEMILANFPTATMSERGAEDLAIPKP